MERDGHEALEAANGVEGLLLVKAQPVDLVVTDLITPEMASIEMLGGGRTLSKPFELKEFLSLVDEVLQRTP